MTSTRNQQSIFSILVAGTLMAVAGVGLISPILPKIRSVFRLSDFQASALVWGYLLPGIFLAPLIGYMADRWGRRRILWGSLFLFGTSGASCIIVSSFQSLLVLRFLQGIGGVSLPLMARTLIGDFYGPKTGSYMGFHDACLSLGGAIFPVIGGFLGGYSWYWPFLVYALAVPVGIGVIFILPTWDKSKQVRSENYFQQLKSILAEGRFLILIGSIFLVFVLKYGFMHTALPFFLNDYFSVGAQEIGYFVGAVGLTVAIVSVYHGKLEEIFSRTTLIPVGFFIYGCGYLITSLSYSMIILSVGIIFCGVAHGILLPSINTAIVKSVPKNLRASAMSLRKICVRVGQALGSPVLAFFGQDWGYDVTLISTGIAVGLLSITANWLPKSIDR